MLFVLSVALAAKPVCGDGSARGSEECDGADLAGESCVSLGYDAGSLACLSDCTFDLSACSTTSGTTCGDDLAEGYEECDGTDDSACSGQCSAHCACPATGAGDLEIHVIDVGQGDAILILSPDGFSMLMDAGTDAKDQTVSAYMASIGLSSLDYTMVSHMDADHVGGMDGILQLYPEVAVCFDHGGSVSTTQYTQYDSEAGSRRVGVSAGDTIDMGSSITVEVVHAHQGSAAENNNSNVIKITHGARTFLIGGDCEAGCEASYDPGKIDVYKVHHHGSEDSSSAPFLATMDPWTATISVGQGNAFGHPDTATLDRLAAVEATVYRTDLDGDIEVISTGSAYTVNGDAVCAATDTRSCGTTDVGACSTGTYACAGGVWDSTCQGAVEPTTEDCNNGLDDDCDGQGDTTDPDCVGSSSQLLLAQVAYDTPGTDSIEEFIDLHNPTTVDEDISGWTLSDNVGSWTIPSGTVVSAGGYLTIAKDAAGLEAWLGVTPDIENLSLSLNNDGDVVLLADSTGAEVDRLAYEDFETGWSLTASGGDSLQRTDPSIDTDTSADWGAAAANPFGGSESSSGCNSDGTCDAGEDCVTCPNDCAGVTSGKPANRYCCGNGTCESVGEDAQSCPVDC